MKIGKLNVRPFVVCVQEYPERTDFILKHFKEIGLGDVEVWDGFNANLSGLETKWTYEADNPGSSYRIGAKPVSTWISFYALWGALSLLPDESFLICEWDAQFHPNWRERTERAIKDLPDQWDLLYLGSCCTQGKEKKHVAGDVFKVKNVMCGHATIVRKKALSVLLKTQRRVYSPLDISVATYAHPHLDVNVLLPRCVDQFETHIPI